ncbi:MAG: Ldh family oxidoreductase [Ectothiorhodospiraceae bacterium]|nr:Ldh family oxidoreductase [Ectothiorhodospiraceae bacterium]
MLEQFHVPEDIAHRVEPSVLTETTVALLERSGLTDEDARLAADVLVSADLRGVETHGVSNMLRTYVRDLASGHLNPKPNWRVVRETPACATIDADMGIGIVIAPKAMRIAIEKGKATGAGLVTIGNGRHLGMAAYHAMMALEHDMIGQCMSSCGPRVAPTFSAQKGFGTNPIAFAAPAGEEPPFVFDAATSVLAHNKIGIARRLGIPLEPGWVTTDGTPIMERIPAPPEDVMLLPIGATREMGSHKGYSLGMVVDILGGLLNGSPAGPLAISGKNNHFVAAYDIAAFIDPTEFKQGMDTYLRAMRGLKPAPGHNRVVYAGLQSHETAARRRAEGIPLHPEVIDWFRGACRDLGVAFRL